MLTVEPDIIERYVRPGRARLIFRDVLNHGERSIRASEAAACAGRQGLFWQMHAVLFDRQPEVERTAPAGMVPLLQTYARQLEGIDPEAFRTCQTERATLQPLRAADAEQRRRGIVAQPIFEIGDRRLFGLQSADAMGAAIEAAGGR